MNSLTLTFKSRFLERMYQKKKEEQILKIFRVSFGTIIFLAIPVGIYTFMVDSQFKWYTGSIFVSFLLIYIYVIKRDKGKARYFLCAVSLLLCAFQVYKQEVENAQQIYLSGQVICLFQMGLISQTGFSLNTIFMVLLMIVKLGLSISQGFFIQQTLIPFAMIYFNYFIYLNELVIRQLFLQTLKEDTWVQILPVVSDKDLIILTYDQENLAFNVKYQNIIKDASVDVQVKETRQALRTIMLSNNLNLETFLIKQYNSQEKAPQSEYIFQKRFELLEKERLQIGERWIAMELLQINLKELNFIIVFEKVNNVPSMEILNKALLKVVNKNISILIGSFKCISELSCLVQKIPDQCIKKLKLKLLEFKQESFYNVVKNSNLVFKINRLKRKEINLKSFSLVTILSDIQRFLQRDQLNFQIQGLSKIHKLKIVTEGQKLQLLLLNIFIFCQKLDFVEQSQKICLIYAATQQGSNLLRIQFKVLNTQQLSEPKKIPKTVQLLYKDLGPYKEIERENKMFETILTLLLYSDLSQFYLALSEENVYTKLKLGV